jgi:hypothetical protein
VRCKNKKGKKSKRKRESLQHVIRDQEVQEGRGAEMSMMKGIGKEGIQERGEMEGEMEGEMVEEMVEEDDLVVLFLFIGWE